jgi:hypothetical protein
VLAPVLLAQPQPVGRLLIACHPERYRLGLQPFAYLACHRQRNHVLTITVVEWPIPNMKALACGPPRTGGGRAADCFPPPGCGAVRGSSPGGARVRARLRVCARDEGVLWAAGTHLGSLAGKDLAARCAERRLDAKGRARSRAVRKRALTAASSSRWAGALTRTSEDQARLAGQNLRAERSSLQARIRRIGARLAVPVGGKAGRTRGYATPAERYAKTIRLRSLKARLRRSPRRTTGTDGQPTLARQARQELPARRLRHPHRETP